MFQASRGAFMLFWSGGTIHSMLKRETKWRYERPGRHVYEYMILGLCIHPGGLGCWGEAGEK